MKKTYLLLSTLCLVITASAQSVKPDPDKKFAQQQLKEDLAFVKQQLFNAHANAFNQLSKPQYEQVFDAIGNRLKDSMTATDFYKTIKEATAWLNDEHSAITIDPALQTEAYRTGDIFLPVTLTRKGNNFYIGELLTTNTGLQKGQRIIKVNGVPTERVIPQCSIQASGFPEQRNQKALDQFGYLYAISEAKTYHNFELETDKHQKIKVPGTTLKTWQDHVNKKVQMSNGSDPITYTRYGNNGYILVPAFNARTDKDMDSLRQVFDGMFTQMKADGVKNLFIDVSKNGGGNSAVGDLLISYFYGKPYLDYQCNFRRSDEYLNLIKQWGMKDNFYESQPVGKLIHFDPSKTTPPKQAPGLFGGKVYVVVGSGTFSSAIMFATIVKDNHIATLVGQIPPDGHPNHFGEMYGTRLPNTKLNLRFGVKEWIRPTGERKDNVLRPDVVVDVDRSPEEIAKAVTAKR